MTDDKKTGIITKLLDRIRHENSEQYAAKAGNTERLDYSKGNIDQNRLKNAGVWESCPVLDELGNPLEENEEKEPR